MIEQPELRSRLAEEARARAKMWSVERIADDHEAFYKSLTDRRPSQARR